MKEHEHATENKSEVDHHGHHTNMAADFRKRFWISRVLPLPIILLPLRMWCMAASTVVVAINAQLLRLKK